MCVHECVCSSLLRLLLQQNILVFCCILIIAGTQIWCTTAILAASGDVIVCGSESHWILFNTCLCHGVTWRPAVGCLTCCCPRLLSSSASVRDHQLPTPSETLMQIRRLRGSHWSACMIFYGYSFIYTTAISSMQTCVLYLRVLCSDAVLSALTDLHQRDVVMNTRDKFSDVVTR